MITSAI